MTDEPTLIVEIAPASTPLATSPTWINITSDVMAFEINRGFGGELDTVADAGTATLTLDGADRRYDPTYASNISPGNLLPGKQVRIRATYSGTTYNLFRGHVEGWPQAYTKGSGRDIIEVQVPCVDGTQYLANATLENDTVVSRPGKLKAGRWVHNKVHGWHRRHSRGPERDVGEVDDLSQYSDLIGYSKPSMYWPVSGDHTTEMVSAAAGDKDMRQQRNISGTPPNAVVEELGANELVQGDEYPPASMVFRSNLEGWFQTDNLDFPDWTALTVECVFSLTVLPSVRALASRLVSGPMDGGNVGPIFTLYIDVNDDLNARVRLSNNTNYTWTLTNAPAVNTTHHAALVFDGVAGTIGAYFDGAGGAGATAALGLDDPGANRNVYVGGQPNAATPFYPEARIQHVAIYNRVLTSTTLLAHKNAITKGFPSGQSATTRVGAILDAVSWPASWRDLNTGTYQTLIGRRYSNQGGMDELGTTLEAEFGRLWLAPDGNVTLYNRDWRNHADFSSSAATFGDLGGELPYYGIGSLEQDDSTKISRVTIKSAADEAVQKSEDTSIDPPVAIDLGEVILDTASSAATLASNIVTRYKNPQTRIRELTLRPAGNPPALWPKALGYDLCQQITIKRRPLGPGDTAISQASHIEQIRHSAEMRGGGGFAAWETTWTVSPR